MIEVPKFKIRWTEDGEEEDEVFDTYEEADEMGMYYQSCAEEGAEILNLSNPGDYPYDEEAYERPAYEIVEVDK